MTVIAHLRMALDPGGPIGQEGSRPGLTGPVMPGNRQERLFAAQLMWRCTFSASDGPGSAGATHGPGIDGSMMPSSSQE